MININDPSQAKKLFSELDEKEDPLGKIALKSVDFRQLGLFFPNKEYGSAKEAQQSLENNRLMVSRLTDQARGRQVNEFKRVMGRSAKEDHDIQIMPYVRVNNSKSQTHRHALEFGPPNMKRVPIAKFLSTHRKETNLHQSDTVASTVTSGIFQPAGAHLPFSKNNS